MFEIILAVVLCAALGLMAYIRFAPADAAVWHQIPASGCGAAQGWNEVTPVTGGAWLRVPATKDQPRDLLAQLNAIAIATPRTTVFAGSVDEGRITWVTRSMFWGFPDYTTAQAQADGLCVHARLRFGRRDFGVNAARLKQWLARL